MLKPQGTLLLLRLAEGDHEALGEFYDLYAGLANGVALSILRDSAEAEDVVQEVFVQIWRQALRFSPDRGSAESWVCTIARTRALDRLRRRTARREDAVESPEEPGSMPRPEDVLAVRQALEALSSPQRRVLELAYYEGLTQAEIADRLGEPLGTVKSRIRDAMIRLRRELEQD